MSDKVLDHLREGLITKDANHVSVSFQQMFCYAAVLVSQVSGHRFCLEGNISVPPKSSLFNSRSLTYWQMFEMERELVKKIEGVKKIFATENAKGVEHFQKFEKAFDDLVKVPFVPMIGLIPEPSRTGC